MHMRVLIPSVVAHGVSSYRVVWRFLIASAAVLWRNV